MVTQADRRNNALLLGVDVELHCWACPDLKEGPAACSEQQ